MKYILITLFTLLLLSCKTESLKDYEKGEENSINNKRIKMKEQVVLSTISCYIIEVDSCEYLTQYKGGMTHLANCKNH